MATNLSLGIQEGYGLAQLYDNSGVSKMALALQRAVGLSVNPNGDSDRVSMS